MQCRSFFRIIIVDIIFLVVNYLKQTILQLLIMIRACTDQTLLGNISSRVLMYIRFVSKDANDVLSICVFVFCFSSCIKIRLQ